jgi:hypothetical protein
MKVRYLDGPQKGEVVTMPYHVAAPLIRAGYVRPLSDELRELPAQEQPAEPECAMREPETERAVKSRPIPRKK